MRRRKVEGVTLVDIILSIVIGGLILMFLVVIGKVLFGSYIANGFMKPGDHKGHALGDIASYSEGAQYPYDTVAERKIAMELKKQRERARKEVEKAGQMGSTKESENAVNRRIIAAFKKSYKKPEWCYFKRTEGEVVACANDYIRARAKYVEEFYAQAD